MDNIFLDALTINNLKAIKKDLGIKKNFKSKCDTIKCICPELYKLNEHQQLDLLKKLNIPYKPPKLVTDNLNKGSVTDLKYTLYMKGIIDFNKKKKDLINAITNINYYYTLPEKYIITLQTLIKKT